MSRFIRQSKYRHVFGQEYINTENENSENVMVNFTVSQLRELMDRPRSPSLTESLKKAAEALGYRVPAPETSAIASIEILAIYKAGPRQFYPLNYRLAIIYADQSVKDETVCSNKIPETYQPYLTDEKIAQAKQNNAESLRMKR